MTSTTLSTANVGPNSLADNVLTKQSASGFGFTGSAEDESERKDNDTTPPLTTDNDADLRAGSNNPPDTEWTAPMTRPDLSMFCAECQQFIELRSLSDHRNYHHSLRVMMYKGSSRPQSVEALLKRRRAILRRLKAKTSSEKPLDPQQLQHLNDAFEFLKANLEETYETCRQIHENPQMSIEGIALNCTSSCAFAVGICANGNERWKSQMEDTRVFQDYFGNDPNKCFLGLYDGHHGRFAAEVAASELHHALLLEMEKFDPQTKCTCAHNMVDEYDLSEYEVHSRGPSQASETALMFSESAALIQKIIQDCEEKLKELEVQEGMKSGSSGTRQKECTCLKSDRDPFAQKMRKAFVKAHKYTDILLSYGKDEQSRVRWSGCSSLTCVIQATVPAQEGKENSSPDEGRKNMLNERSDTTSKKSELEPPVELGTIHLANAGNVQGVLVRGNQVYKLTKEHTPYNDKEQNRVLKMGGTINRSERELRVGGILATTRGLGNHGDLALKRCISIEPYTTSVKIDQYAQALVLATSGLWEVFSKEEVMSLLLQVPKPKTIPANYLPPPSRVSTSIHRLLATPPAQSNVQSELSTDAEVASQMLHNKTPSSVTTTMPECGGSARPTTGQSQKSKVSLSVKIIEEPETRSGDFDLDAAESIHADMQTEVGSRIDGDFNDEDYEADIDTFTDGLTLCESALSGRVPTKEEMQRDYAKTMAERLVQAALLAGTKDNITVMVVLLPGCGI